MQMHDGLVFHERTSCLLLGGLGQLVQLGEFFVLLAVRCRSEETGLPLGDSLGGLVEKRLDVPDDLLNLLFGDVAVLELLRHLAQNSHVSLSKASVDHRELTLNFNDAGLVLPLVTGENLFQLVRVNVVLFRRLGNGQTAFSHSFSRPLKLGSVHPRFHFTSVLASHACRKHQHLTDTLHGLPAIEEKHDGVFGISNGWRFRTTSVGLVSFGDEFRLIIDLVHINLDFGDFGQFERLLTVTSVNQGHVFCDLDLAVHLHPPLNEFGEIENVILIEFFADEKVGLEIDHLRDDGFQEFHLVSPVYCNCCAC